MVDSLVNYIVLIRCLSLDDFEPIMTSKSFLLELLCTLIIISSIIYKIISMIATSETGVGEDIFLLDLGVVE